VTDDVINISSGIETSLNELASLLLRAMDSSLAPQYAEERTVNNVRRRLADTTKARHLLGFEARVSLEDGLRRLVDWWRDERGKEGA
jgi:UDP-glucose 4-epimerase